MKTKGKIPKRWPLMVLTSGLTATVVAPWDAVSQECLPEPGGIVAWWPGDEGPGSGGLVNDVVGTANGLWNTIDLSIYGSGKVGACFSFNGWHSILVQDKPALNPRNGVTAELWVLPSASVGVERLLVGKIRGLEGPGSTLIGSYLLTLSSLGTFRGQIWTTNGLCSVDSTTQATNGNWCHVAMTYDRASSCLGVYVNGVLENSAVATGPLEVNDRALNIGHGGPPFAPYPNAFQGLLDEIALYDRGLTPDEIHAIYVSSSAGKCAASAATIVQQPRDCTAREGEKAVLRVFAGGTPILRYQWFHDSIPLPSATDTTLVLENVRWDQRGKYTVIITNAANSVTSNPALLDIRKYTLYGNGHLITSNQAAFVGPVSISIENPFTNGWVFYTQDGTDPATNGVPYAGPFTVTRSVDLRTVAYNTDFSDSYPSELLAITVLPSFQLLADTLGGGSVSVDPPTPFILTNSVVTVSATPSPGWTFVQWLGDAGGTNPTLPLTMSRDKHVRAVFATAILTNVVGSGALCLSPVSDLYPYGTVVRVTAVPSNGYFFLAWGGSMTGTENPMSFTVTAANQTLVAAFASLGVGQYTLTPTTKGLGQVWVTPATNRYSSGASVTLLPLPDAGQTFLGWAGDATGAENPLVVAVTTNMVIVANFTKRPSLHVGTPLEGLVEDGFRLTLMGEFGAAYTILSSTDLHDWMATGTVTNTYGTVQITDSAATTSPFRFYRATSQ